MIQEFKKFIMRGNVVDLAVGIIIGSAFKDITKSLVNDIIMPPIGQIIGGVDFSKWKVDLSFLSIVNPDGASEAATLNIGVFVNAVIDFVIIALAVFALIKLVNKLDQAVDDIGDILDGDEAEPEPAPEPEPEPEPEPDPEPTIEERLVAVLEKLSSQLDKA